MELTALHLEHGAEEYQASRPAIVQGTVHHTSLRDGLSVVSAQFALETALSSSILLPPGLAVSLVLGGQAALRDGQCHGPGTYIIDLSTASRWRRLHAEAGQCFSFVSLNAPLHALDRLGLSTFASQAGGVRTRSMPVRVMDLARFLLRAGPADPASALLREAASLEIVARLLDSPGDGRAQAGPITRRELQALEEVRSIIAGDLQADLTIDGLAQRVGLSLSRLKSLYSGRYGVGLGASVIEARLTRAHALLHDEGRQVAEVAYAVGYTPAHFATAFRKRFGHPPSAIRRQALGRSIP